jgi:hypothetical protein
MCSDPLVEKLREKGYNPVRLPRADIKPLQLLAKSGKDLSRLGPINSVLESSTALPSVHADVTAANIEVRNSGFLRTGLGLSILGAFLKALGADGLELDAEFKNAHRLVLHFDDILEDRIDVSDLDSYLTDADMNPKSRYAADLLVSDGVYVITSVLKSKSFAVEAISKSGGGVDIKADAIQQVVGAKVGVHGGKENKSSVTFEGSTYLGFGFQAVRLLYDNGGYTSLEPVGKTYLKAIGKPDEFKGRELYEAPGVFGQIEGALALRSGGE